MLGEFRGSADQASNTRRERRITLRTPYLSRSPNLRARRTTSGALVHFPNPTIHRPTGKQRGVQFVEVGFVTRLRMYSALSGAHFTKMHYVSPATGSMPNFDYPLAVATAHTDHKVKHTRRRRLFQPVARSCFRN